MTGDFEVDGLEAPAGGEAAPGAAEPMVYVATPRPGVLRRAGAGAWHMFSGFWFLFRRPQLWPLAALPTVLAAVCVTGGLLLGAYSMRWLEGAVLPAPGRISAGLSVLLYLALWVGTLAAGVILGLAVTLLLTAPILERMSRRVEEEVRVVAAASGGWRWELAQSFKAGLYFLAAAPVLLLMSLVPVVGPLLGLTWGAHALAMQLAELPLARRGLDFRARLRWHRRFLAESIGFGTAGLVLLLVPCANFVLAPALAVGGTLMVLELEEDLVPADRTPPVPPASAR
ncbi:MAG TPA: EI24 domain-containing protein [Vicinamibacteria bacterium]|nr:EI24 domain-containing protein [Vicinamibacteria bacterium]